MADDDLVHRLDAAVARISDALGLPPGLDSHAMAARAAWLVAERERLIERDALRARVAALEMENAHIREQADVTIEATGKAVAAAEERITALEGERDEAVAELEHHSCRTVSVESLRDRALAWATATRLASMEQERDRAKQEHADHVAELMHDMQRIGTERGAAEARAAALLTTAMALRDKMRVLDAAIGDAFSFMAIHGAAYSGPTWEAEAAALDAALTTSPGEALAAVRRLMKAVHAASYTANLLHGDECTVCTARRGLDAALAAVVAIFGEPPCRPERG